MVNSGAHTTADKGGVPSAAQHENDEAYLDYGFSAGRGEKPLYPTRTAAVATEQVAAYCNPGMHAGKAIPLSPQVQLDHAHTLRFSIFVLLAPLETSVLPCSVLAL